jgi:hypothetical protein
MGTNARLGPSYPQNGLKPKDLCGIPWRVAFALQADGWYLRSDIIWSKPNPMPESVTDRPTKAHEYVFLLSKSAKYFWDQDAVREPNTAQSMVRLQSTPVGFGKAHNEDRNDGDRTYSEIAGRNIRSVWTIPTQPFEGAHFATFPERLVEPMIKAGCPAQVCRKCGKPRERITERESHNNRPNSGAIRGFCPSTHASLGQPQHGGTMTVDVSTVGWSDCGCGVGFDGGVVLDPFFGSGTVGVVAKKLARHFIGIELNPDYCKIAEERLRPYMSQTVLGV